MRKGVLLKASAIVAAISGFIVLFGTIYPIASYESTVKFDTTAFISPLTGSEYPEPAILDYTKASNWFVGGDEGVGFSEPKVTHYTISVPKLNIENATVAIGGEDLSESLIQYPGTALPGKAGSVVVFGHSILPQFYDPKDYMAIFSTLPTLTEGDEIVVSYDGITYKYRVEELFEVLPTDFSVLDQNPGDNYILLITCSPPGHPLKPKRLVAKAKIVPPESLHANIGN